MYAYHLCGDDRDEHGHWWPRLYWADGGMTRSAGRIRGSESFEQAQREVGNWNWAAGISVEDKQQVLTDWSVNRDERDELAG